MDNNVSTILSKRAEKTAKALKANNFEVHIAENKDEARTIVQSLLADGCTVSSGGSASLGECGIYELLRSGKYNYLDRSAVQGDEVERIYRESFSADAYLCSANAVTEDGVIYNVDGNSNRVAAIAYGPKSVIMVVGVNKIVKSLDEAVQRVKSIAAPANTTRLQTGAPCSTTGECAGRNGVMTAGCACKGRICCNYLVSAYQRHEGRIKVIIVKEPLGF